MENNMEIDTARSPEPHHLSPTTDPGSIPTLDGWIENLMSCKQLAENDVQRLCDRVCLRTLHLQNFLLTFNAIYRREKFFKTSLMSSQWYVLNERSVQQEAKLTRVC
jgi:hypothetical protein